MSNVSFKEQKSRKVALWIIGLMIVIWTVFGIFSFIDRGDYKRPQSVEVTFSDQTALMGKKVFQAYNCMDCHTIVGNGAYFAPDLTKIYEQTGPAWLKAYLGSPGTYPTEAIVNVQFNQLKTDGLIDDADIDAYYTQYTGAKTRVDQRGGIEALMPNLRFSKEEIDGLIAFLKYTAMINTAGWPPEIMAKEAIIKDAMRTLESSSGIPQAAAGESASSQSSGEATVLGEESGEKISASLGCMACHSSDGSIMVGPSWKNLYGTSVHLKDGRDVVADDDYLKHSITHPNDEVVDGFQQGVMPSYEGNISDEQLNKIIDYIKSLK